MAQWGNTDDAANSVFWAVSQFNKTANTTNQTALFGNTTADAFVSGITVGQYAVDTTETPLANGGGISHAGWVLRTEGSGGRNGRIFHETLVAMGSVASDSANTAEDIRFPDS